MDNDIDPAETIAHRIGHERAPFGGGHICRDKQIGSMRCVRRISSSRENPRTHFPKPRDHRFSNPLRAARDERAAAIQFEIVAHERISSDAILSPSSVKTKSSSIGLPGKFPVSRLVTMILPSFSADVSGSIVCWYFLLVSASHCWIAAKPSIVWPSSRTTAFWVKHWATISV